MSAKEQTPPITLRFQSDELAELHAAASANFRSLSAEVRFRLSRWKGVPDGYVLAPLQPTREMLLAGSNAADGFGSPLTRTENAYKAMLSARGAA